MSHYSDVGFKFKNEAGFKKNIIKLLTDKNLPFMFWNIDDGLGEKNPELHMKKIGEIRYFCKVGVSGIEYLCPAHNNERISSPKIIYSKIEKTEEGYPKVAMERYADDFPTIQVIKDDIPFWFCCPNCEIFFQTPDNPDGDTLKLCSFANYVNVKEPTTPGKSFSLAELEQKRRNGEIGFADESYIAAFKGNKSTGYVSGIIRKAEILKNQWTKKKYYAVDVDCLGLYFKMLIDPKLIKFKKLQVGKILFGEFWNVAILVASNHPDYF